MKLLNPKNYSRFHPDDVAPTLIKATIDFFEKKGLESIKKDDQASLWYQDYIDFVRENKVFAKMLTPEGYGEDDSRWDMWRISEFNEILGFYGLSYWYAWQVSILGLGPIWMSDNEEVKNKAAAALLDGGLFAFGLSEKDHGADIYSTGMTLYPQKDGTYLARGSKYYIGNGNAASLVSTFGKIDGSGEYVFFVVCPEHSKYECVKKISTSGVRPAFVSEYRLDDYPISESDILTKGSKAWDNALNTVNVGKYELGFASVGISTHAFYEAIKHAANRVLYKQKVTDFPHVKKLFTEAYSRLIAMKLYGHRAADYMRHASAEDRRYLLYNPIMKMKVTSQGEQVVGMLHDVIAAKGFEQDTYFEMAIRDIGMLPKLEGTTHVNMALIVKFIKNYFFDRADLPEVPQLSEARNDSYLFQQVSGGLSKVRFPDYSRSFDSWDLPNINIFREQIELYRSLLIKSPPTEKQAASMDFMIAAGEVYTLIPYAQLILENARIYKISDQVVNEVGRFLVKDLSTYAWKMIMEHELSVEQEGFFRSMMKKPAEENGSFEFVWENEVLPLKDVY